MKRRLAWLLVCLSVLSWRVEAAPTIVRVGLLSGDAHLRLTTDGNFVTTKMDGSRVTIPSPVDIRPRGDGLELNGKVFGQPTILLTPASGVVRLEGRPYRGAMEVVRSTSSTLSAVNHVSLEDYVRGVLGGEVPSSWPLEALKAQAVASRSYALAKMTRTRTALYDVVNTDRDQVYEGVAGEHPGTDRAVRETAGLVLAYNGQIIKAYFSAACGGHTEDGKIVFGEDAVYLKGVPDPYCSDSPYQTWGSEYTIQQIKKALLGLGQERLGQILAVEARSRTRSGRIGTLVVKAEKGEQLIAGIDLRRILGYRELRSTRFNIKVGRTIPVYYETIEQGPTTTRTEVSLIPDEIEIGLDETQAVWHGVRINKKFRLMDATGSLSYKKPTDCYVLTAPNGKVTREPRKLEHGIWLQGLQQVVVKTKFVVELREERVVKGMVRKTTLKREIPVVLLFNGHGWGHGVGMCQWGCRGQARQGASFDQILRFYYPGTQLSRLK